jgi:hypothetical protein
MATGMDAIVAEFRGVFCGDDAGRIGGPRNVPRTSRIAGAGIVVVGVMMFKYKYRIYFSMMPMQISPICFTSGR